MTHASKAAITKCCSKATKAFLISLTFGPVLLQAQGFTEPSFREPSRQDAAIGTPSFIIGDDPLADDPFADDDPFAEENPFDEDPFAEEDEGPSTLSIGDADASGKETSDSESEQISEFEPRISFIHRYRVLGGLSQNLGVLRFINQSSDIREIRFITSYQQTIKIQSSPQLHNFVRLSIDFAQNYDVQNERYLDNHFAFREIYLNYSYKTNHQFRLGTQIYRLGKVELDRVIDELHFLNLFALNTLDPSEGKDSLLSVRYTWTSQYGKLLVYAAPLQQRTLGMDYTEFRREAELREQGQQAEDQSFIRDYFGVQYEWKVGDLDSRVGFFRWFDNQSDISFEFVERTEAEQAQQEKDGELSVNSSFIDSYQEKESRTSFVTLELDASLGPLVWKMDSGLFDGKNFYHYYQREDNSIDFDTVEVPYFATASSLEQHVAPFYWNATLSHRRLFAVPENTHILFYENRRTPTSQQRALQQNRFTGFVAWDASDTFRVTALAYRAWPFPQRALGGRFIWKRLEYHSEWVLHLLRVQTDHQHMIGSVLENNQVFVIYTRNFF